MAQDVIERFNMFFYIQHNMSFLAFILNQRMDQIHKQTSRKLLVDLQKKKIFKQNIFQNQCTIRTNAVILG